MSANVQVIMSGDEARLFKSLAKVIAKETEMATKFADVGDAAKKAGQKSEESFGTKALAGLTRWAAGFATVQGAVQLVNRELEEQKRLRQESAQAGFTLAKSQQEAIKNLSGLTSEQKARAITEAKAIQNRTQFPSLPTLTEAIGAGFSASGDVEATLSAVEASARLNRLTPEQLPAVASGALDVGRGSGIGDAKQNLGFLLSAGGISRIEDPTKLSTNLAPVVSSGVELFPKQDRQEAARQIAAVFGAMTAGATDRQGNSSSTATNTLLAKLSEFFKDRKDDPGTVLGRIRAFQQNKQLREQFLSKPFGEERFKGPIRQLLTANSQLANMAEKAANDITFNQAVFEQHVKEIETLTPELRAAASQATSEGNIQQSQVEPGAIKAGTAEEVMKKTLDQARGGIFTELQNWAHEKIFQSRVAMGANPEEAALYALRDRRLAFSTHEARGFSKRDIEGMALIDRQIAVLENLRRSADQMATAADKMASAPQSRTPPRPTSRPNQLSERSGQRE